MGNPRGVKRDFEALEQRRLLAIKLFGEGLNNSEIGRELKVANQTVSRWCGRAFRACASRPPPGDGFSFQRKVVIETRDELVRDECELFKPMMEIEQVTVLAPLQQRTQLGAE